MVLDRRHNRGKPLTIDMFLEFAIPEPNSGCWIWMKRSVSIGGYGIIRQNRKNHFAHRLAFELSNNCVVPKGMDVCHRCDNRLCVNPDHLFVGTRKDNMQDCSRKGRIRLPGLKAGNCPSSKLTEAQVLEIRLDDRSTRALARIYNVNRGTISLIKRRITWRSI